MIIVGVIYLLLYGFFLTSTNGLPYVMDNNESFSCMIHAENMYKFGFSKSYGLTDESASLDAGNPNAHPFVHTHQGNFPRLFSFLLYLIGARTVEAQIIITTLTVGLATILLAYHFIAKITFPFFSLITYLLMMSDYVLFSQWQVNIYRVWYGFFFFYTLCCVYGIGGRHKKLFLSLLGLNFICIFYWEFAFASFLWTLSAAYALFLYRKRLKLFGITLAVQCLGAALALGILFSQLVLYMGLENVLKDAYYTISARNFISDPQKMAEVQSFYENVNIAFFLNFMGSAKVKSVGWFLSSIFKYNLIVYTPYLVFICLLLVGGWFINSWMGFFKLDGWWRKRGYHLSFFPSKKSLGKQAVLFLSCFVLFSASWMDFSLLGVQTNFLNSIFSWKGPFILLLSAVASFAVVFLISKMSTRTAYWSSLRVGVASISLLLAACFVRAQGSLYGNELEAIWREILGSGLSLLIYPVLPISAGIFLMLVLDGKRSFLRKIRKRFSPIWPVLCCALLGYWVAWLWAAGYLHSGYLVRWCPFINFAFYPLIALAVCTPFILLSHLQIQGRKKRLQEGAVHLGQLFLLAIIAFLVFYWSKLQILYIKYLPPTHAQFLKELRKEPFKGSSFISNHYALPIAHMTKDWAYQISPEILDYLVTPSRGLEALKQATTYRWFADRYSNPAYTRPQYFLYWDLQHQLNIASNRIAIEKQKRERDKESIGYLSDSFVRMMLQQEKSANTPFQIVACDKEKWKTWAIIKLDWNRPPYLMPLSFDLKRASPQTGGEMPGAIEGEMEINLKGRHIKYHVRRVSDEQIQIHPIYRYQHSQEKPEEGSILRLYQSSNGKEWKKTEKTSEQKEFTLPSEFKGKIRMSATPRGGGKKGMEYFGPILSLP